MTVGYETILDRASKVKKLLAIGATVLVASVALASPAWAGTVGNGRILEIDYTNDFVLLEGYPAGSNVTVDVIRGGAAIGTFTGQVGQPDADGVTTLEINHAGPDLNAADEVVGPGDCWQNGQTPNIRPSDKVRVSGAGIDDYTFVRNLDYEDVNGSLMGVATGNELADGTFANTPISLAASDPAADPTATIDARRAKGTEDSRTSFQPDQISQTSGAFNVPLAGAGGDVSVGYLNVTGVGGEESTVAGPFGATAPDLGCENVVNDPAGWAVDTLAPDAPSIPDLDAASDTGSSSTDNVTLDTTPTFTGNAESRSTVEILFDGNVVGSGQTIGGNYSITVDNALASGTYDVTARATDAAGNVSVQSGALSVTIEQRTSALSLNASSQALAFGQSSTLSGRLSSSGAGLAGKPVILERKPAGASAFSQVGGSQNTGANGSFSFAVKPAKNTAYRVSFAGERNIKASNASKQVNVRALVSNNTAIKNLKLSQVRNVVGKVSPAHAGKVVKITIKRPGQTDLVRNLRLSTTSTYKFSYKPIKVGRYSVSVQFAGDADHLGSKSVAKSFRVIR